MIEAIIKLITSNIFVLIITIIICMMIVLFIVKKLFKMAIITIWILVFYIAYLFFTGQKVPTSKDEWLEHGSEQLKKHRFEDKLKEMKDNVKDKMKESIKEELFKKGEKELERELEKEREKERELRDNSISI